MQIALLEKIEPDLRRANNEVRFIHGIVHGDIIVSNRKRAELLVELRRKNFDPFPMKLKAAKPGPRKKSMQMTMSTSSPCQLAP